MSSRSLLVLVPGRPDDPEGPSSELGYALSSEEHRPR